MLSTSFLKEIGLSNKTFTTLVKGNSLKAVQARSEIFEPILKKFDLSKDNKEDFDYDEDESTWEYEQDHNENDYAGSGQSRTCCGVFELSTRDDFKLGAPHLKWSLLYGLNSGYHFFVYYSINKSFTKALLEMGFKEVSSFKNPNSGNVVTVLMLNVEQ